MVVSLSVGCCVEGSYGPFLPSFCNPDGSQEPRGKKCWLVKFDNGEEKECPSLGLKLLEDPRYGSRSVVTAQSSMITGLVATNNGGGASLQSNTQHSASAIVSQSTGSAAVVVETGVSDAAAVEVANHPFLLAMVTQKQ